MVSGRPDYHPDVATAAAQAAQIILLDAIATAVDLTATSATQDDMKTALDNIKTAIETMDGKTPSTTDIKIASDASTSSSNETVIEVASGSGWLLDVTQLLNPYEFGTMSGYITITIDGVVQGERMLTRAVYIGSYPGTFSYGHMINVDTPMRYETSLKVEHRIIVTTGGEIITLATYTEE